MRVRFLKRYLEERGHRCVVLNIGSSRTIPSDEYETVLSGLDYVRKVWRFSREGLVAHVHVNGSSWKGFGLALSALLINLVSGRRSFVTFHAGIDQVFFPRHKSPALWPVLWTIFTLPRTIICNTDEVKARIVEYGVGGRKIVSIPAFSTQYLASPSEALPAPMEAFYRDHTRVVFCYARILPMFFPQTMVEGFARLVTDRGMENTGLILCGTAGHVDDELWKAVLTTIDRLGISQRVLVIGDLSHGAFLHALRRASVYLRTHVSDGACASISEALALGTPVVASENHTRPPQVRTYPPDDAHSLARTLAEVLCDRDEIVANLRPAELRDTLAHEANLLMTS